MRTHEQIFDDSTEGSPFSNGESGERWMSGWCYRCRHDAPFQRDESPEGCPIILVALMQRTPKEWTEQGLQDYACSEFVPDDEGDADPDPLGPPPPVAEMDGQIDIFAVFTDTIVDEASRQLAPA